MKNKKYIITAVVLLLALSGGILIYSLNNHISQKDSSTPQAVNEVDYSEPKDEDKIQPSSKDRIIDGSIDENGNSSEQQNDLNITITQANQRDNTVHIRALVSGAKSGTCSLNITKGDFTVTKEASVGVQASYSICQGFNIPVSEFSESGEWQVELIVAADGKKSIANTNMDIMR